MAARRPEPLWLRYGVRATMLLAAGSALLMVGAWTFHVLAYASVCLIAIAALGLHLPAWFLLFGMATNVPRKRFRTIMTVAFAASVVGYLAALLMLGFASQTSGLEWFGLLLFFAPGVAPLLPQMWSIPVFAHGVMFLASMRFCGSRASALILIGSTTLLAMSILGLTTAGIVRLGDAALYVGMTSLGYLLVFLGYLVERRAVQVRPESPLLPPQKADEPSLTHSERTFP